MLQAALTSVTLSFMVLICASCYEVANAPR